MATQAEIDTVFGVLMRAYAYTAARQDEEEMAETLTVYEACLVDIDTPTLKKAALRCIKNSRWFPTVADLRDAALHIDPSFVYRQDATWLEAYYGDNPPPLPPSAEQALLTGSKAHD
jgi:hypothetical protein